ncbi:MAG: LacI family transcriptional regulator [Chloroflexi bacterium]|nr:LacI family transcriptional regulator [Chloroflexota bacterium]
MSNPTIYDVAQRAGVSISTVSRVLNRPERVNKKTRERVLAAIDELGFIPKAEAIARARKSTRRIGVLAPFFTAPSFVLRLRGASSTSFFSFPSFMQRLRGVFSALADLPYELVIYNVDSVARRDAYLSTLPVSRRLDGLIVMALPFDEAVAQRLLKHRLETVLIEAPRAEFCSVDIDNVAGGRLAAEYLVRKGHRRCAFVGDAEVTPYALRNSEMRLEGYRQALADAGIPLPDAYISRAPHGLEQARRQGHALLDLPQPPTAVFAASDTQAMGVLKAARERGVRVPDDLAVIGFDDLDIADYIGLTTVRQPLEESGRVAVELLLARLTDRSREVQHVHLPLTIVERETA